MASTILGTAIAASQIKVRWKEPYASQGINEKHYAVTPHGVYRGFILTSNAGDRIIDLVVDPTFGDSAAICNTVSDFSADQTTVNRRNMTISGLATISVDMSAVAGDHVLVIGADHTTGDSAAYFAAWPIADYDVLTAVQKSALVALGTITVPVGVNPITVFSNARRTLPGANVSPGDVPWIPLLKNPGFEANTVAPAAGKHVFTFWEKSKWNGAAWVDDTNIIHVSGSGSAHSGWSSLGRATTVAASTNQIFQNIGLSNVKGRNLDYDFWMVRAAAATGGTGVVFVEYEDSGIGTTSVTASIPLGAVDAVYVNYKGSLVLPATAMYITRIGMLFTAVTYAAAGSAILIDDFQVSISPPTVGQVGDIPVAADVTGGAFVLNSTAVTWPITRILRMAENATTGEIDAGKTPDTSTATDPTLNWKGLVKVGENRVGSAAIADLSRISAVYDTARDYTLLFEAVPDGIPPDPTQYCGRIYACTGDHCGELVFTTNAKWDNTASRWNKSEVGYEAKRVHIGTDRIVIWSKIATDNAAWTDAVTPGLATGWTRELFHSDTQTTAIYNNIMALRGVVDANQLMDIARFTKSGFQCSTAFDNFGHPICRGRRFFDEFDAEDLDETRWYRKTGGDYDVSRALAGYPHIGGSEYSVARLTANSNAGSLKGEIYGREDMLWNLKYDYPGFRIRYKAGTTDFHHTLGTFGLIGVNYGAYFTFDYNAGAGRILFTVYDSGMWGFAPVITTVPFVPVADTWYYFTAVTKTAGASNNVWEVYAHTLPGLDEGVVGTATVAVGSLAPDHLAYPVINLTATAGSAGDIYSYIDLFEVWGAARS